MVAAYIRQRYAEEIRANTNITSAALLKAFASVPREVFAGSGPWKVLSRVPGQMQPQAVDVTDPTELYHDVAILLDHDRHHHRPSGRAGQLPGLPGRAVGQGGP